MKFKIGDIVTTVYGGTAVVVIVERLGYRIFWLASNRQSEPLWREQELKYV